MRTRTKRIDDLFSQSCTNGQLSQPSNKCHGTTVTPVENRPGLNFYVGETSVQRFVSNAVLENNQVAEIYEDQSNCYFNLYSFPSSSFKPIATNPSLSRQCRHDSNMCFEPYYNRVVTKKNYRKEAIVRWKSKKLRSSLRSTIADQQGSRPKTGTDLLDIIPEVSYVLPVQKDCPHCGAKKFFSETANFCCSDGGVALAENALPDILVQLLTSSSEEAKSFRTYIRTYNNLFAFTSLGVKYDKDLSRRNKGIYTFRVQGQVYHFLNDLSPAVGCGANLQLYFHDTENELSNRLAASPRLLESVTKKIMLVLEENPYARFFRSLRNVPNLNNHRIILKTFPDFDQRVYNKPTASQVAALWIEGEENGETSRRNIRVHTDGGHSRSIEYYYGCYDPLQYPLLLPFGELGWHQGIPKKRLKAQNKKNKRKRNAAASISPSNASTVDELLQNEEDVMSRLEEDPNFVSIREYYAYKLQIRASDKSFLLHFGRLLQQYVVDQYVKVETQRLDFFRSQQEEIRKEFLQGIVDAVADGETQASNVGQRVFLPPTFIGGPRNMRRKYMDAMTLVQKFGKPDIFLTMTCNSNWPEIKENLAPKEEPQNRPDLISRIFHAKLEELKIDLLKKSIFGEVAAYAYVIEYQKRGLPHAHILLILKSKYKMYSPEEYDRIVCAEIPDKKKHPHLYKMVIKHMLHGPCGMLNPSNVCMKKNGTCKNNYPKDFCEETTQTSDAYPAYRRSNNGVQVMVRNVMLDNRWVVPYNPYLLAKFDCHINVEICSTIKAVKYIYKYICKGHDKTSFAVVAENTEAGFDEIKQYVSARWVSPPEAVWRIYRFPITEIKPAVIHLQLHLENYQPLSFKKHENLQNIANNSFLRKTMLTEFFHANRTNKDAQDLNCTYSEFPSYFVWKPDQRCWKLRQRGDSVGRIMTAHPSEGERYFFRLILSKVQCPVSFADLRTYNAVQVDTFHEAALLRGLLQDNNSQELCLEEASLFHMPYEMRRLFATLLVYSCPNDPKSLWQKFEYAMSEDFVKFPNLTTREIKKNVFQQIDSFLQSMGKSIHFYNLIPNDLHYFDVEDQTRDIRIERNITVSENNLNAVTMLNDGQKQAFTVISERIYSNESGAFFVDGPGGTGKTFLYRALLADVRSKGYIALATATSGIASSILPGGRTAHSRFKIPIDIAEGATCRVSKQTALGTLIKEAKLIIWDEAPMSKRSAIEALDDLLKDLMNSEDLFGGKVVVLGGDFGQTLPVVRKGTKSEIINACLINSPLWNQLQKLKLTDNMRARLDPAFTEFLLRIGDGTEQTECNDIIKIPSSIVIYHDEAIDALHKLIDTAYPEFNNRTENSIFQLNRAILTTKNHFVDEINDILIEKFPGEKTEYLSFDETLNPNDQSEYVDLLNTLSPSGLPPHSLLLKPNSPVILLRNLDPAEGLCNGTRLICKALTKNLIHAEIAFGDFAGKEVFIHRIPLHPPNDEQYPVAYKRTQFPVKLCFAMTINKAQGQTLDFVGVYLKEPVFSHGQLYVALSRAKTSSAVKVLIKPVFLDSVNVDKTKNIVYREVLEASHGLVPSHNAQAHILNATCQEEQQRMQS